MLKIKLFGVRIVENFHVKMMKILTYGHIDNYEGTHDYQSKPALGEI